MEVENLIKLIEAVSESDLTRFKYEDNGVKLHLTKKVEEVRAADCESLTVTEKRELYASGASEPATADVREGKLVKSPLVGTFYAAPAEGAEAFVSVGDSVKKGQILAIVEAMKLMNEIESEYDGVVEEVLVENGQAVEYGQPLFRVR